MPHFMGDFRIDNFMMRYSIFVPRFYNLCKSYGFEAGKIMPSRAFCSDENQGFPIILITKHFGTFPFNHGQVGGIVATDRHGPHSHHGRDMAIIQASHVGYDPMSKTFGSYRRLQMDGQIPTPTCGKICGVASWYEQEYRFAQESISFTSLNGVKAIIIDNQLLNTERKEGVFLSLEKLRQEEPGNMPKPLQVFSTAKAYEANVELQERLPADYWQEGVKTPVGDQLSADFFQFRKSITTQLEGSDHLENNLIHSMPHIITSPSTALAAAQVNTQVEFDRAYRSIAKEESYHGKNLAFIAGLHIDISPNPGQIFPLTKFIPWAAYIQTQDGGQFTLEQGELMAALGEQSTENLDQIDLEEAIADMEQAEEVIIKTGH
ncbi:MAG: hypothetical protein RPU64_15005 [Candidatus Sedimenticola sp. (ex Thyasira tokunagai)]